jgi:uncharacterized membrane protein YoaK (UPF0700 family)
MVRQHGKKRKHSSNLQLGSLTAITAGMVNVASVMAFFTFSSNITGHMAIFAEEIIQGNLYQSMLVFIWLGLFLLGSFTAHFLITRFKPKYGSFWANSIPILLEILVLLFVGFYGVFLYSDTLLETELLVGLLLFAMGNQNGIVATISNSVVKTTHLTGLFTDLGMELSRYLQNSKDQRNNHKLQLHLSIASFYLVGGLLGGALFVAVEFGVFFGAAVVLTVTVLYDPILFLVYRARKKAVQSAESFFRGTELLEDKEYSEQKSNWK